MQGEGHVMIQAETGGMQLQSHGPPRIAGNHHELGRDMAKLCPRAARESMVQLTL